MSSRTESADRSPFNRVYLFLGGLVAVTGVLLIVVVWLRQENDSLVRSASSIQLGATSAQVTSALGVPDTAYNAGTATGACYGRMSTLQFAIEAHTGRMTNRRPVFVTDFDDWPVHEPVSKPRENLGGIRFSCGFLYRQFVPKGF